MQSAPPPPPPPPGWYADPTDSNALRWWSGTVWTENRASTTPQPPRKSGLTGRLNAAAELTPAHVGKRLVAWFLDCLMVAAILAVAYADPGMANGGEPAGWVAIPVVGSAVFLFWNWGWRQGRTGQSLGKQWLGLKLVRADGTGRPVGVPFAMFRAVLTAISSVGLWGIVSLAFATESTKGQRLADKIFDTQVIAAS